MSTPAAPRDPEELEAAPGRPAPRISAQARLGPVRVSVRDLERSIAFYGRALGLVVLERQPSEAQIGPADGGTLLVLDEEPGGAPAARHTGLYHVALLLPERADLAAWLLHAARSGIPLAGLSDHFVSLAIYLSDPDGHGLEIYWDRPREVWEGQVAQRMTTLPLDVDDLLSALPNRESETFAGLPAGTVVGHVHLKVARVDEAVTFYRDVIGLGLMAALGNQAAFLSAGGYHHHFGANSWESRGATPPPPGSIALQHATLLLPEERERGLILGRLPEGALERELPEGPLVRDPSGNRLLLAVGT